MYILCLHWSRGEIVVPPGRTMFEKVQPVKTCCCTVFCSVFILLFDMFMIVHASHGIEHCLADIF